MTPIRTAYVVMTAMPPTKGHMHLIDFAKQVGDDYMVILFAQPHEPMVPERYMALWEAHPNYVRLYNRTLPQDPETEGFWDLWKMIMNEEIGVHKHDYIVASEHYGQQLADITGATFVPYDPYREITPCKATDVREEPASNFHLIAREFQPFLRKRVTIFGAESTGKTTLTRLLAHDLNGHFFMEWARPYLETCGSEITLESMTAIWKGQAALEAHSESFFDKPFAFFDTDLYSTIGYWLFPHWHHIIGDPPQGLLDEAIKSDLYIITPSNIPFEEDPLRYGGDQREGSDEYWIDVAERFGLNYVVLEEKSREGRLEEAAEHLDVLYDDMRNQIAYDRGGF